MENAWEHESASSRLLYDDERPRLRPEINPTRLRLRKPSWLLFPIAFVLAAGAPGVAVGEILAQRLPYDHAIVGSAAAAFQGFTLLLALLFARRDQSNLALLTPYYLSSVHAFLAVAVGAAFVAVSFLGVTEVEEWVAAAALPEMDSFGLQLALVYVATFALFTVSTLLSTVIFRLLGLVRVPIDEEI